MDTIVTHDLNTARETGRIVRFRDGRIVADEAVEEPLIAQVEEVIA